MTKENEGAEWGVVEADYKFATPGYFEAIGARLLAGRFFDAKDNDAGADVVVVDRQLAAVAWPGQEPVGKYLKAVITPFDGNPPFESWLKVVGVIEDIRSDNPGQPSREAIYFPHRTQGAWITMAVVARAETDDPAALVPAIRAEIEKLDSDLPVAAVGTMDDYVRRATDSTRFVMILTGIFAGLALLLASIGLYGVISSLVRQRTHEIGLYMAFGAESPHILRMVVRRGMILAIAGVVVGLLTSLALTRVVAGLLTGVTATDPPTFVAVGALLTVVTVLASYIPAHRAVRVDPMEALRYE
jgi:predicted permease